MRIRQQVDADGISHEAGTDEWWIELARRQQKRFWLKAQRRGQNQCWRWKAGFNKEGYGKFAITAPRGFRPKQRHMIAHRMAWMLSNGAVPVGLFLCHKCDHPWCVRPDHLFLGTQADNRADCARKGRTSRGERHPKARLTEETVRQIKLLREIGKLNVSEMASSLGVGKAAISAIATGRTWGHVEAKIHLWTPDISALHLERKPGLCIACDGKLPKGRPHLCRGEECLRIYSDAASRDYRARETMKMMFREAGK